MKYFSLFASGPNFARGRKKKFYEPRKFAMSATAEPASSANFAFAVCHTRKHGPG